MLAFGLYETLRLLVPGGVAVGVLLLVLRLVARVAEPGPARAAADLAGQMTAAALAAGFLLYLLDLPKEMRLYVGADPDNRPSEAHVVRP